MCRSRSNALVTGAPISVSGFPVATSIENIGPDTVYCPAPSNPTFFVAYQKLRRAGHPCMGWKLHVSAYPYNCREIANAVLPVLCKLKIWHKYVRSPMQLSKMTDGQRGKFITIYTNDNTVEGGEEGTETEIVTKSLRFVLNNFTGPHVKEEKEFAHLIFGRFSQDYNSREG